MTEQQAAAFISYTARFLQARRAKGTGPKFVRISSRSIRYRRKDLVTWIEQRIRTSTSDSGNAMS
jgi:predicted DNA-binding transcriptional regulator AlpA